MDKELILNNKKYLSSKHAGKISGYTNDYVARLARHGKVEGKMVGRTWYVEEKSLNDFIGHNKLQKTQLHEKLSNKRVKDYKYSKQSRKTKEVVNSAAAKVSSGILKAPKLLKTEFFKKGVAATIAVAIVFGGYFASDTDISKAGFEKVVKVAVVSVNAIATFSPNSFAKKVAVNIHNGIDKTKPIVEQTSHTTYLLFSGDESTIDGLQNIIANTSENIFVFTNDSVNASALSVKDSVVGISSAAYNFAYDAAMSTSKLSYSEIKQGAKNTAKNYLSDAARIVYLNTSTPYENVQTASANVFTNIVGEVSDSINKALEDEAVYVYTTTNKILCRFSLFGLCGQEDKETVLVQQVQPEESKQEAIVEQPKTLEAPRTVINQPVIERVVQTEKTLVVSGITRSDMELAIQQLKNKVYSDMSSLTSANETKIINNYQTISHTNKIDKLGNVTISNSTISGTLTGLTDAHIPDDITISGYLALTGGTLTGALDNTSTATSTFSGGLSIDVLNVSTTTATSTMANGINITAGCFSIDGTCVSAGGGGSSLWTDNGTYLTTASDEFIDVSYYVATSSSATSTFAGGLAIETSGFVYDYSTNNVGIGTASPTYKLDVNGVTRTSDLITSSLVFTSSSTAYSTLTSYGGFNGYINASGGFGTGGNDSVLNAERITSYGNLVNIGSIQAGEMSLTSAGTFATKVDYTAGVGPYAVSIGDLNGDGKADLAVANYTDSDVSVLINNGDGTFATKVDYTAGAGTYSVAIGDLNGDGKADLATANSGTNTVSVLINNGDGTFATKVDYTTGSYPESVSIGDLNGDGKADLAVSNYSSDTVSVFINNGDGTFATKVDYTTGSYPESVSIGDLNGDGKADLAVANENSASVSIFINNGDGTFATKVDYDTGTEPYSVSIGDLNGDGKADLAVANYNSTNVSVFINNGDGTFATKVDYTTGVGPYAVSIGDLNGDGKADLAVANYTDSDVSVFINNGDGTFAAKVDYTTGTNSSYVSIGDLNGDGKADLAVANYSSGTVSVFINNTNTMFFADASTSNVGIGTSTPYSKLSVWGNTTGNIFEAITNASSSALSVSATGFGTTTLSGLNINGSATSTSNVGIDITAGCFSVNGTCVTGGGGGATVFGDLADVATSSDATGDIWYLNSSGQIVNLNAGSNGQVLKLASGIPSWAVDNNGGGGGSGFWATTTNDMIVYPTDASDIVVVGSNATTTTGNILEVVGNSLFGGAATTTGKLSSYSFMEALYFNATSTTATSTLAGGLDVSKYITTNGTTGGYMIDGNLILQASSTNFSTFVGDGAGTSTLASGLYNTAVGYQAFQANTTGDSNTAQGYQVLYINTTGGYNSAQGYQALYANTTGYNNSAQGYYALYSNTTGYNNSAQGGISLYANTTGNKNSAQGYASLYSNTTGIYNSAQGYKALYSNTTGSYNSAQGNDALYRNTTGSNNAGLGSFAGYYNQTGDANTLVGYAAGFGNSGNSYASSTLVGYYSGYSLTTGDSNILLGYQAGDNITTGSNNIILGYDIDAPAIDSSNILNIGNLLYGTGIDGSGTTLSSGNIGIGTSSPYAKLSVVGQVVAEYFTATSTTATSTFAGFISTSGTTGGYRIDGITVLQASSTNFGLFVGQDAGKDVLSDGTKNTAIGYQALYTTTSADSNTAVGYKGLYSNTTGSLNTAQGAFALTSNTTGWYNTAQGGSALYFNTTGSENTAQGYSTLRYNTSATSSTAIGYEAGRGIATYNAGELTIVGAYALYSIATGAEDVTALGYKAGYANTTGANNIYLGYKAGDNIITGSNNIILGYDIDAPANNSANILNIGNLLYGTGIDGTGTTLSSGNIGIGTSTPEYKLDVNGVTRTSDLITSSLVFTSSSTAYSTLTSYGGFNGYINASGGFGTGGNDSVLNAERITSYGNLTNIGSIQAGEVSFTSGGTFFPKVDYGVGAGPYFVSAADFNGDGKADLAVANLTDADVSILLSNGDGTFATKVDYPTGVQPYSVSTADLNGDGKADLAVANRSDDDVSVLINNGDGTFATKVDYPTGLNPRSVYAADFNGDGKADLATANNWSSDVSVFINNGDGTFATKVDYPTGIEPRSISAADFNGDGKADLAVANDDDVDVSVLINNGDGTFATKVDYPTGTLPYSVSTADYNGDGKADLAVANRNDDDVSVFINNGDGTFATKVDYPVGVYPYSVYAADFNGDGKADLAVANGTDGDISILINNGDGTFATKVDYGVGVGPRSISAADFNGDGKADLAIANFTDADVSILINNSNPIFLAQASTGFVGIGTSTPYSKLSIWGGTTGNIFEVVTSASSSALSVSATGFGTTTLSGLNINGSATSTSNVGIDITAGCFSINGTCVTGGGGGATVFGDLGDVATSSDATGDIWYLNSSGQIVNLNAGSNGQVLKLASGIPSWAVDNNGGGGGSGFWATTTNDMIVYPTDTSDIVVIGSNATTTTGNILEVIGNSLFGGAATTTGKLSSYSFMEALYFNATSTTNKSFFAGGANTSGTTGGYSIDDNLILQASSTNFSMLVGDGAGKSLLTSGEYNTAVGYQALYSATSSDSNTAIGFQALYSNTTGRRNSVQGYGALYSNTTGSYNAVQGYQALVTNTTGSYNSAQGYKGLYSNTTGSYNTGLGASAGFYNQIGDANTTIGYYAGFGNSGNSYASSTLLGYKSGFGLTTGDNNILLGYQAGDNITTGSNNIILGYDIDAPAVDSANILNIGNLLYGTGIDGSGTTLSSGNIGIGTSSPYAKLSVVGQVVAEYFTSTSTTATSTLAGGLDVSKYITTNGTTGGYMIDGNLILQASSTNFSTFVGDGAGTSTLATGLNNTAVGYQAFQANTTGDRNSAQGYQALYSNTTGGYNSAQGYRSLYTNTTGNNNSAQGYYALRANTTGSQNSAQGSQALYSNTTGSFNIAQGYQTLYYNSTGNHNIALGYAAGYYNQTGGANITIGYYAGIGNSGNSYASSTLIGYYSGAGLTTGSGNIILGYQAGDNITTGSNNIILGYDIDAPANNSANILNIGNLLYGTGIDGTGTTLSSGNIGIGTTTPYSKLSIWGNTTGNIFEAITNASSSALSVSATGFGTTTLSGLNINGSATSTSNVGIDITAGCFSVNGTCVTGGGGGATVFGDLADVATSSDATGDIWYLNSSGQIVNLNAGSNGQVLKLASGIPSWAVDNNGGGGGSGFWATTTNDMIVYPTDTSDIVVIGSNATTTTGNILEVVGNSLFGGIATTTGKLSSYSFMEAPYFNATSTTATSTFAGGLEANALNITSSTASSTFANGINLTAGCFSVNGTCVGGGGGGSGTINSGTTNRLSYYSGATTLDSASFLTVDTTNSFFGVGTSTPWKQFSVSGDTALDSMLITFASTTASTLTVDYATTATSTIVDNQIYAWTFATSTTATPIFSINTGAGDYATSSFNGGFDINSGALTYDASANKTSIERLDLGATKFEDDAGTVSWIDMSVTSSAPAGTAESYTAQIDGNSILTIYGQADGSGNLTDVRTVIGTSTDAILGSSNIPYGSLIIADGILCVDDGEGANCDDAQRFAGGLYATSTTVTAIDLAENYPTKDTNLEAGDVVMFDSVNEVFVTKYNTTSTTATNSAKQFIGVISTNPGVLLGGFANDLFKNETKVPVTLSGRVPVKINLEGGDIAIGDRLTASSVAGVATRATTSTATLGVALEAFTASSTSSTVLTFIDLAYSFADAQFMIDGNGNIGVGTTSPEYKIHVVGDIAATSFVNISTKTSKKDIEHLTDEEQGAILEKLEDVAVAQYRYKYEDEEAPLRLGLIAEEAPAEVLSVSGKGVDIYKLATFTLAGVQELADKVGDLEMRIADVEAQIAMTAAAGGSGGAGASLQSMIDYFVSMGVRFVGSVTHIANLVVENLTIGSAEKPNGITLYDEVTGEPYCVKMSNGALTPTLGACESGDEGLSSGNEVDGGETLVDGGEADLDTQPPTITINGNNPAEINIGDTYADLGATVTDDVNENLGIKTFVDDIEVTQININTASTSTYIIAYTATDQAGNTATSTRTVLVTDPNADTTAPTITLIGTSTPSLLVGDAFTDEGATATDDKDGDITANITIAGDTVDTTTAGVYTLTYDVSDNTGNTAIQIIRTITVTEPIVVVDDNLATSTPQT